MSIRYLLRRESPAEFEEIRQLVSNLDDQLGPAGADFRREIEHTRSPSQRVVFGFSTQKVDKDFLWRCHSIELVAETEKDFYQLASEFGAKEFPHLSSDVN